jgi:hypothetical protein
MKSGALAGLVLLAATAPVAAQQAPMTAFHFAGYADATWARTSDGESVGTVTVAPILHLAVGERLLLEVELEGQADTRGVREGGVEYATANWMLGDHAALVVGKFLSPVGSFFANQHPSWINRLPSAPPGFGHGGAAPLTDVGVQLRGGVDHGTQSFNYAAYVANGPRMRIEGMGDVDLELEGAVRDPDGRRVAGGRVGWLPVPTLEFGASAVRGRVRLLADGAMHEPARGYQVDGVDVAWRPRPSLDLRAEWLRQRVDEAGMSMAPDRLDWRAWYVQGTWGLAAGRWEAVLRQGDAVSPHAEATLRQTAIGVNRLWGPRRQLKFAYEFNTSPDPSTAADRLLAQWAYAF